MLLRGLKSGVALLEIGGEEDGKDPCSCEREEREERNGEVSQATRCVRMDGRIYFVVF